MQVVSLRAHRFPRTDPAKGGTMPGDIQANRTKYRFVEKGFGPPFLL
jgi:hypothetical protein